MPLQIVCEVVALAEVVLPLAPYVPLDTNSPGRAASPNHP